MRAYITNLQQYQIMAVTLVVFVAGMAYIWLAWEPVPPAAGPAGHELCDEYEAVVVSGMNVLAATTEMWAAQIDEGSDMVELDDGYYLRVPESQIDGYIEDYRATENALASFKAAQCPGWQDAPDMPYDINEPLQYLVY